MWRETHIILRRAMRFGVGLAAILACLFGALSPGSALAVSTPVLITAIQTAGEASAGHEYIRLVNTTDNTVDLAGGRLEYFAASPKSFTVPSRIIALAGSLAPKQEYFLAAKDSGMSGDATFAPTLAAAGGHLRLASTAGEWDFVGWGTATRARGESAEAPPAGKALIRKQLAGQYLQTGSNKQDFMIEGEELDELSSTEDYTGLIINELLPDPAAPSTDTEGEFIELFNGSNKDIALLGLSLVSGITTTKSFSLPPVSLASRGYLVFFAPESRLSLANGGGRVQLLNPGGRVLDQTSYDKAIPGASWARNNNEWSWNNALTPGQVNLFEPLSQAASTTGTAAKKTTKKIAKKSTKVPTKKSAGKGAVMSSATDKPSTTTSSTVTRLPVHNGVVAGVGVLAVLYGIYEYRYDALNLIRKLRRNREAG